MLRDFLQRYNIDEKAVERIKHRLIIVGRFNQSGRKDPEVFLFSNRPESELPDPYKALFTDRRPMAYERFVELLKPSLAEHPEWDESVPHEAQIPRIRQMVPRDNEQAREGTVVVDVFHYLFQRAISSTRQAPLKQIRPRLPIELESLGNQHAGKGIFKLIRKSLNIFAQFQPKTHLIVDAMSRLLDTCARENGMPPYAHGDPLPGGFPEKLIDFVYAEDSSAPFDMSGLDLSTPPWSNLQRNDAARKMFQNLVVAFRDALLGLNREQFGTLWFQGRTLNEQANVLFSGTDDLPGSKERKDLADSFNRARDAFNTLKQVLRSKALISMILDWLVDSYYSLPQVPQGREKPQALKDRAVAELILKGADNVAKPIIRPSKVERDRFAESLVANFERLLNVLYEKDDTFEKRLAEDLKDPELQRLARTLRGNKRLLETLGRIAAPAGGVNTRQAFIDAAKTVLLDVLCPVLFDQPILTEDQLRMFFRQETSSAYLTAIFLSKSNKDEVALIGHKNIDYFKKKIDEKTKEIRDVGEIQEKFLGEFIDLLASEEIQRQMQEGLRVLREAQTILANMPKGAGAGSISAVRPDPAIAEEDYTLTQTAVKPAEVEVSLRRLVEKLVVSDKRVVEITKRQSVASAAGSQAGASPSAGGSGSTGDPEARYEKAEEEPAPEAPGRGMLGDSRIAAGASAKVDSVLTMFFGTNAAKADDEPAQPIDVKKLTAQAGDALLKDEAFMGEVRRDIESYEQVLFLIYQRYVENSGSNMSDFTNGVDRLTLINMMSLFQDELGLGTVSSNLHYLLIDMVRHLDRENPDPAEFIRKVSLTRYFDDAKLGKIGGGWGITNLRETLRAQAYENLGETQSFASELWGIRYLMEQVKSDRSAEVIVVNATADEFMAWLKNDNLNSQRGSGRFRSEKLVSRDNRSAECIQPGLIYFTDSAFASPQGGVDGKNNFLAGLAAQASLNNGALRMLLPPICISTRVFEGDQWRREAENWATTAAGVPAPVIIVGPSAFLNDPEDYFKTYLPAGYMFAAHFLSRAGQSIRIDNVNASSNGRFRVIGSGADYMHKTLDRVFWPAGDNDSYGFAVDYYLYIILTILTAAAGDANPPNATIAAQYYENFFRPIVAQKDWRSSADAMTPFLTEGQGACFSLACTRPVQTPDGRSQDGPPVPLAPGSFSKNLVFLDRNGLSGDGPFGNVKDIAWFDLARQKANLH